MLKKILFLCLCFSILVSLACQSVETPNTNSNTNVFTTVDQANLPPGFSTTPLPANGTPTPGIPDPADINITNKIGPTPIPGIPDSKDLGKPLPKGKTPIPGIPDSEIQRTQPNKPAGKSNSNSLSVDSDMVQNSNNNR